MSSFEPRTSIHELGDDFYDAVEPADFNLVGVRYFDEDLAKDIGLNLTDHQVVDYFLHFKPLEGSLPEPLALRYHGHQFRHYNPDIGDGRGFLFAQCEHEEKLLDFGTKGSGTTPFSRSGDGRLTLLGGVREALATTHLHAMGVNTSRTLALIETDEALQRHDEPSPTRAAVMTRLSHSHIRFGTFQRQAFFGKTENLEALVQYCIRHFYAGATNVAEFYDKVVKASADTVASWMAAGFVHGVMNTDNMNITGESFDYGPYRFLPYLEPGFTAAYFDHNGLYAFGRQPDAMGWNLAQLAQSLSLITEDAPLIASLENFADHYQAALNAHVLRRLGVTSKGAATDNAFIQTTFQLLKDSQTPWPQFWHDWHGGAGRADSLQAEAYEGQAWTDWATDYAQFEPVSAPPEMDRAASLLYEEIGALWQPIAENDDWSGFEAKLTDLSHPV
ncbi:protein adenylyltransferase SelO family protein [Litorimonas sp. WD9-15]|uniref:protein adenylyltransferase SelO family protein n=1 Tax=Litorimonas sp. WD9-15 TaxID=3418716 RepID=UPI003CFDE7E5